MSRPAGANSSATGAGTPAGPGRSPAGGPADEGPGGALEASTDHALEEAAGQFLRFSVVGVVAFLVDAATLQSALWLGLDPYSGRVVSYLAAATAAWVLNRRFTFRLHAGEGLTREWLAYLGANAVGGAVNYLTYAASLLLFQVARDWPVLGVAAGSLAGLGFNFVANKYYVFRRALSRERERPRQ